MTERLQYGFFLIALVGAWIKIAGHLGVIMLPVGMFMLGGLSYLLARRRAVYLFFSLLPLVNALPDLGGTGYPFNYLAPALFYLSGMVVGSMLRGERVVVDDGFLKPYLLFLTVVGISAIFVFLRWSNLTLSHLAFFRDTPVEPYGNRISFASIFPVVTFFLYGVSPFAYHFIRSLKLDRDRVLSHLGYGFLGAVGIAVLQKTIYPDLLARKWWLDTMGQANGTFSDFNALGIFSGVLLVVFTYHLGKRFHARELLFSATALVGVFLSGSRTAFIFVLVAFGIFLFRRGIRPRVKIAVLTVSIVAVAFSGGILTQRLQRNIRDAERLIHSARPLRVLDEMSNWRITMIRNSAEMFSGFPLAGVGTGNFLFALKFFKSGQTPVLDLPLNHFLLILDENGAVGLLCFSLFLFVVFRSHFSRRRFFPVLYGTLVLVLLVNNFLWLPEMNILFWVMIALYHRRKSPLPNSVKSRFSGVPIAVGVLLAVFIGSNVRAFQGLHPNTWSFQRGTQYDYGFWYAEKDSRGRPFHWTRDKTGIFIRLNPDGRSADFRLVCGAPIAQLADMRQQVDVYWRGKAVKRVTFTHNGEHEFHILDADHHEGFLELRVNPVFNLKAMGLSPETRDLGVKFFILPKGEIQLKQKVAGLAGGINECRRGIKIPILGIRLPGPTAGSS